MEKKWWLKPEGPSSMFVDQPRDRLGGQTWSNSTSVHPETLWQDCSVLSAQYRFFSYLLLVGARWRNSPYLVSSCLTRSACMRTSVDVALSPVTNLIAMTGFTATVFPGREIKITLAASFCRRDHANLQIGDVRRSQPSSFKSSRCYRTQLFSAWQPSNCEKKKLMVPKPLVFYYKSPAGSSAGAILS